MNNPLDLTFGALADPTRRAILAKLAQGEASVTELAAPFDMSLPAISRHLKVLEQARLISRGRDAQWRPCRLEPQGLKDVAVWMEEYRRFWAESLDQMQAYVEQLHAEAERSARREKGVKKAARGKRRGRSSVCMERLAQS